MNIKETIKDAIHNHTQGMSEEDVKFFENQTKDKIISAFKEMVPTEEDEYYPPTFTTAKKKLSKEYVDGFNACRKIILSSLTEE